METAHGAHSSDRSSLPEGAAGAASSASAAAVEARGHNNNSSTNSHQLSMMAPPARRPPTAPHAPPARLGSASASAANAKQHPAGIGGSRPQSSGSRPPSRPLTASDFTTTSDERRRLHQQHQQQQQQQQQQQHGVFEHSSMAHVKGTANSSSITNNGGSSAEVTADKEAGTAQENDDDPLPHISVETVLRAEHGLEAMLAVYEALGLPSNTALDNACVADGAEGVLYGGRLGANDADANNTSACFAAVAAPFPSSSFYEVSLPAGDGEGRLLRLSTAAQVGSASTTNNNSSNSRGANNRRLRTTAVNIPLTRNHRTASSSTPARRQFSPNSFAATAHSTANPMRSTSSSSPAPAASSRSAPAATAAALFSVSDAPSVTGPTAPKTNNNNSSTNTTPGTDTVAAAALASLFGPNTSMHTTSEASPLPPVRPFVSPFRLILEVSLAEALSRQNAPLFRSNNANSSNPTNGVSVNDSLVVGAANTSYLSVGGNSNGNVGGGDIRLGSSERGALGGMMDGARPWLRDHHSGAARIPSNRSNGGGASDYEGHSDDGSGLSPRAQRSQRRRQQQEEQQQQQHHAASAVGPRSPSQALSFSSSSALPANSNNKHRNGTHNKRGGVSYASPAAAATAIANWYRRLRYRRALADRRSVAGARGAAAAASAAASTIQRWWLSHRQRLAFRARHAAFLESYLNTALREEEAALTLQAWLRSCRRSAAVRAASALQRAAVAQLASLPTGAQLRQEQAYAVSRSIVPALGGRAAYRRELQRLREVRERRAAGNADADGNFSTSATTTTEESVERAYAAHRLQQWWRARSAVATTAAKRAAFAANVLATRRSDAAYALCRFRKVVAARVAARERQTAEQRAARVRFENEKATVIQSFFRMARDRVAYVQRKNIRSAAALTVQSAVRRHKARRLRALLAEGRLDAEAYRRLIELVVGVQSAVRGFLVRQAHERNRRARALFSRVQPLGRAFIARRGLREASAAITIQRAARLFFARCAFLRHLSDVAAASEMRRQYHAAFMIQRSWRKRQFRAEIADRIWERSFRNAAARKIQHAAGPLIARGQLRTLKQKHESAQYERHCAQSATLIAACYRGYAQHRRYGRIREILDSCSALVARVAKGYFCRRFEAYEGMVAMKQQRAAERIQRGVREWRAKAERRERLAARRAMALETRARTEAAIIIQRNVRMMQQLRRYTAIARKRRVAATLIASCGLRCLQSVAIVDAKKAKKALHFAAFVVQRCWVRNRRRLAQQRSIREMEERLAGLVFVKLIEHEAATRAAIADEEALEQRARAEAFVMLRREVMRRNVIREERWLLRCPLPVQLDAILSVQSVVRGFLARRRARKMRAEAFAALMGGGAERDVPPLPTVEGGATAPMPASMRAVAAELRRAATPAAMVKGLRASSDSHHYHRHTNSLEGEESIVNNAGISSDNDNDEATRPLPLMGRQSSAGGASLTSTVAGTAAATAAAFSHLSKATAVEAARTAHYASSHFLPRSLEGWLAWLRHCKPFLTASRPAERLLQREVGSRRRLAVSAETLTMQLFGEFNLLLEAVGLPPHTNVGPLGFLPEATAAAAAAPSVVGAYGDGVGENVDEGATSSSAPSLAMLRTLPHVSSSPAAATLKAGAVEEEGPMVPSKKSGVKAGRLSLLPPLVISSQRGGALAVAKGGSGSSAMVVASPADDNDRPHSSSKKKNGFLFADSISAAGNLAAVQRGRNALKLSKGEANEEDGDATDATIRPLSSSSASASASASAVPYVTLPPIVQRLPPTGHGGRHRAALNDVADVWVPPPSHGPHNSPHGVVDGGADASNPKQTEMMDVSSASSFTLRQQTNPRPRPTAAAVTAASHLTVTTSVAQRQLAAVLDRLAGAFVMATAGGNGGHSSVAAATDAAAPPPSAVIDLENLALTEDEVRAVLTRLRNNSSSNITASANGSSLPSVSSITHLFLGGNALRDGICADIAALLEGQSEVSAVVAAEARRADRVRRQKEREEERQRRGIVVITGVGDEDSETEAAEAEEEFYYDDDETYNPNRGFTTEYDETFSTNILSRGARVRRQQQAESAAVNNHPRRLRRNQLAAADDDDVAPLPSAASASATSTTAAHHHRRHCAISHISLANTLITDVGASHLAFAIARCPSVRSVDLSGTAVSQQFRTHIQQTLSHRAQLSHSAHVARVGREEGRLAAVAARRRALSAERERLQARRVREEAAAARGDWSYNDDEAMREKGTAVDDGSLDSSAAVTRVMSSVTTNGTNGNGVGTVVVGGGDVSSNSLSDAQRRLDAAKVALAERRRGRALLQQQQQQQQRQEEAEATAEASPNSSSCGHSGKFSVAAMRDMVAAASAAAAAADGNSPLSQPSSHAAAHRGASSMFPTERIVRLAASDAVM